MTKNASYKKLGFDGVLTERSKLTPELQLLDVDRVYFSGDKPVLLFVDVKSFDAAGLKKVASVQKNAWNYRKILLLFACSETEIRIYNCLEKPKYVADDCDEECLSSLQILKYGPDSDRKVLDDLVNVFSRIGIDCGLLWSPNYEYHKKVSTKQRLDKVLVESLKATALKLEKEGLEQRSDIIHALLMRSLFILFLEDKGAAKEAGLYEKVKPGANSYFDVLKSPKATYKLFRELEKHFNGNIFPIIEDEENLVNSSHLDLIRRCFIDGDLSGQPKLFDWRLFDFKIISIELLSEIYENFLGELKKEKGQFYTPYTLVNFILDEKLPVDDHEDYNVRILDPACGSGIFLVEAYKRLIKRWNNSHPGKKIEIEQLRSILTDNIYGIEIEASAIKVAAFSLYLALVDELEPKTLWIRKNHQLPYLISDTTCRCISKNKRGKNLYLQDAIGEVDASSFLGINLVVGNPPFGTKKISASVRRYLETHKLPSQQVLAFIRKSVEFAPEGDVALIFNTKSLTNIAKSYQHFRKWLFKDNYVEKVFNLSIFRNVPELYGGRLFDQTNVPISIVYFRKKAACSVNDTIEYWAPKTYVKSNLVDGVVIDSTDIKYLPREECQTGDNRIWKIAMWGSFCDFNLIARLNSKFGNIQQFIKNSNGVWFKPATGYQADIKKLETAPGKLIRTQGITRYYTPESETYTNTRMYREIDNPDLFKPSYICIKEGRSNKKITVSKM